MGSGRSAFGFATDIDDLASEIAETNVAARPAGRSREVAPECLSSGRVGGQDRSKAALSAFSGHLESRPSKGAVQQIVVAPRGGVHWPGLPVRTKTGGSLS